MKIGMNLPVMVPGLDRDRILVPTTSDPDEVDRVADLLG